MHTYTALTLLSPYVIKVSVWVVIGFRLRLFSRSINRPSVQQLFLSSCHDAFGCQLFSPLGFATKFLGIRLLIGKHTWRKCRRQNLLITQSTRSKNRNDKLGYHEAFTVCLPHLDHGNLHILRSQDTIHTTVSWAPVFYLHIPMKEILGAQGWDHHWTTHKFPLTSCCNWGSNPWPSCCEAIVLTTKPTCRQ